ncbi:hypothetical protein [Alkalihalobacterium chitinilyticum]|uniref:Uncharacterized protein n=1 Tax=Alkalihalobacterium chitinilyticum TaxID=2980103 RepID=A0ABT5VB19_9BACI|nr:hypothetical protein [Alkalihalobacterium chitinilyticum]MDE5412645.1 hypothetical protein [Alkalihalobacterium chitinilyticum]
MKKILLTIGVLLIIVSFYLLMLGLMNVFPLFLAAPALFISVVFTVSVYNQRNRFRGFR